MLKNQNSNKHIPFLDGLRGTAILLVLFYHCLPEIIISKIGWIGVDLFFVLSGFLITGILLDTKEKPHYFKNFFIRRALRIFPLYYLFLILVFFILPFFQKDILGDFSYYKSHQLYFWTYVQNWLYSYDGFPKNYALHHLWSLGVEEQFYIFWPFIVFLTTKRRLIGITIILILSAIVFRHFGESLGFIFPFQYVHILSRMDALLLGALVIQLLRIAPELLKKLSISTFILSGFIILAYIGIARTFEFWLFIPVYSFIGLFFASFLAILCCDFKFTPKLKHIFNSNILKWLGKYSYGLYIYHYPLYFIGIKYLIPILTQNGFGTTLSGIFNGLTCIFLSCFIAYISFQYFEVKFLALKDRFTKN